MQPADLAGDDKSPRRAGPRRRQETYPNPDHEGPVEFTICRPNPIETTDEEEFFSPQTLL